MAKRTSTPALVTVVMGSDSDWKTMEHCVALLNRLGVPNEHRIVSAHRTPDLMAKFASAAAERGVQVIIAGAGGAAHLPGMIAAQTWLPVLGVPVESRALKGLDSLLSIAQMPAGVAVGTLAIGVAGAKNAALLAASIIGLHDARVLYGGGKVSTSPDERRSRAEVAMTERKTLLPGATIGVMGGGQLGRMFASAARRMGYRVHTFSPEKNGPAAQFSDWATVANYGDEAAVTAFAREIDVLTFEFENIPTTTIEWATREQLVRPRGEVLLIAQDRLREKEFLAAAGFPVAPFCRVKSAADLRSALEMVGRPSILKSAAFGYDGKGQQRIDLETDLTTIWSAREDGECVLERVIDFEKEISVIVARGPDGKTAVFPVCENIHRHHILDLTLAPAGVSDFVAGAACDLACKVAKSLDVVGLLAVEMFLQSGGELIINEIAPRPHNSGHWTIEGCVTSQFEQQVRAVCGLPLGETDSLRPSAMVNLLGDIWSQGEPDWAAALAEPNVHLHLYGKHKPRPGRKMGHLTALAGTVEAAAASAQRARERLQPG